MQWGHFTFGPLDAVQRTLYENQPQLPYQQFRNYFGQGQTGFENTVFGRWLSSQQDELHNDFLMKQAANVGQQAIGGPNVVPLTWTSYLEQQANQGGSGGNPALMNQFKSLPAYMRGSNAGAMQVRRELW